MRRLGGVLLLGVLALAACGREPGTAPAPSGPAATPTPSGAVAAPKAGAYVGAWVKPERFTQEGRVDAIAAMEQRLGRPLNIVHTYRRFEDDFLTVSDREHAKTATLMLSWAGTDTRQVTSGRHDEVIRRRARQVKAFGKPLLLRWRWEMDRPNLRAQMWSADDFVKAWKHVRSLFAAEGVANAAWVWCPTAEGFERDAADFYPGDDQVDWTCADVYASKEARPLGELLGPFLGWATKRPKPIIIGEYGIAVGHGGPARARWLREAAALFKQTPHIKAVCYFDSDPDGRDDKHQYALRGDEPALTAFAEMARDPYFNP